jgi:outer membrane protein TolC
MNGRIVRTLAAVTLLALAAAPAARAQEKPRDYSKQPAAFPDITAPYRTIAVPPPSLVNTPRVEQLISDGKLQLSLQDAISLALENNLDISVSRYTPWLAETDVLRTRSGAGTPIGRFDPQVTSLFSWDRRSVPVSNPFLAGTGVALTAVTNQTSQANFTYTQGFMTGTAYSITFNNNRQSTTSPAQLFNPSIQSSLSFGFQQQLLNGFGFVPNTRFLKIARNNKRVADLSFTNQVITTVSNVQNLYWGLVAAREDVKVRQRSVELAEKLYNDNKRQVEIGTLAPIEVVRAEAEVARTRQDLIIAQTTLLQSQTNLKNAIARNLMEATLMDVEVVPTDLIVKPPQAEVIPLRDAVEEALEKRPDIKQSRIDLETRGLTVRAARNALLPTLLLSGQYGGVGLSGNTRTTVTTVTGTQPNLSAPVLDAAGNPVFNPMTGEQIFASRSLTSSEIRRAQAGLGDALETLKDFAFPSYSVQFNLTIPIKNRAAQADSARALLEQRQAETRYRQLQNTIFVEVRNAQIALEQARARVEAAQKSRELAERTLDAEQKKYQLGASTIFFVIQAQRDLAAAQSAEVASLVNLMQAKVEFDRALGRTLEVNRIDIAEAQGGQVHRNPLIPGTPSKELVGGPVKY